MGLETTSLYKLESLFFLLLLSSLHNNDEINHTNFSSFLIQRFETVASLAANMDRPRQRLHVWWDTRLGTGSGGFNCIGLRLGHNGQIPGVDLTCADTIQSKVRDSMIV